MSVATSILFVVLALAFLGAGSAKLRTAEPVTGTLDRLQVSRSLQKTIGALEVLGAVGLLIGVFYRPLGIAAGIGLVAMMLGALSYHVRARDTVKEYSGALTLLALSAVTVGVGVAAA